MPLARCPKCQAVMQVDAVPDDGSLTCILCGGSIQAHREEEEDRTALAIDDVIQTPHRQAEVQDFVKKVVEQAERDADVQPYRARVKPVGLIFGWLLVV